MAAKHWLIEDLRVGKTFSFQRDITEADLHATIALTQDHGGYHVDEDFAKAAGFRTVIAPGLLQASMATKLGGDLNYLAKEISFTYLKPVYAGDRLNVVMEVVDLDTARRMVKFQGRIFNQDSEIVLTVHTAGYLPKPEWGAPQR